MMKISGGGPEAAWAPKSVAAPITGRQLGMAARHLGIAWEKGTVLLSDRSTIPRGQIVRYFLAI